MELLNWIKDNLGTAGIIMLIAYFLLDAVITGMINIVRAWRCK